jgi:nicotinate dehydrogenase subunit A
MEKIAFSVNGKREEVRADPDTPLLYVLRNDLGVLGPKFGCGLAQCGACTVHMDGTAIRSCATPVASARGTEIATIEAEATPGGALHALRAAFIEEQAAQCGYCLSGWIMTAAALLRDNPDATDEEIRGGLSGLKCRCGAHMAILRAVKRAQKTLAARSSKPQKPKRERNA